MCPGPGTQIGDQRTQGQSYSGGICQCDQLPFCQVQGASWAQLRIPARGRDLHKVPTLGWDSVGSLLGISMNQKEASHGLTAG